MAFVSGRVISMDMLCRCCLVASSLIATAIPGLSQQTTDWVSRGMEAIGRRAAFHTDFTFDRTMLQVASGIFDNGDPGLRHAIARLDGISVHSYRFAAPGMYNPRTLEAVRRQYNASGWQHMVTSQVHGDPTNPGRTDIWIHFQHADITGAVVLFTGVRNLNLIAVSGDLSPLDLLHLRGHFGIPKFDSRQLSRPGAAGPGNPLDGSAGEANQAENDSNENDQGWDDPGGNEPGTAGAESGGPATAPPAEEGPVPTGPRGKPSPAIPAPGNGPPASAYPDGAYPDSRYPDSQYPGSGYPSSAYPSGNNSGAAGGGAPPQQ
jgi:hypothetical protein